jgi:hypothetical protein
MFRNAGLEAVCYPYEHGITAGRKGNQSKKRKKAKAIEPIVVS